MHMACFFVCEMLFIKKSCFTSNFKVVSETNPALEQGSIEVQCPRSLLGQLKRIFSLINVLRSEFSCGLLVLKILLM